MGRISATATSIRAVLALQHTSTPRLLTLVDDETGVRNYVATGDPLFLSVYRHGVSNYASAAEQFDNSPSVDSGILTAYLAVLQNRSLVDWFFRYEIKLMRVGQASSARTALAQGKTLFDPLPVSDASLAAAIRLHLVRDRALFKRYFFGQYAAFRSQVEYRCYSTWFSSC